MSAERKKSRYYHATAENTWALFGEVFWKEHVDCRNKIRQQLAPLVRGKVCKSISITYVSEETASQLCMVTETGFVELEIAKMVLEPDELPANNEAIYSALDLKPTILAAIENFKVARALLHGSLRDDFPELFAKVVKMSRIAVFKRDWDTKDVGVRYCFTFPARLEARIRAHLAGYLQQFSASSGLSPHALTNMECC